MIKKNTIPNIWTAQENALHLYKVLSLGLGAVASLLVVVLLVVQFRAPLVVVTKQHGVEFYPSERKRISLEKPEVEQFTKDFLVGLYVWNEFSGEKVAHAIAPLVADDLANQIIGTQSQKYLKELKGKHLSQSLAFVKVSVLEDRVLCKFDRILKIDGIPLVIPTEVTLSLIEGEPTAYNPMGIFVGGVKENENVK